MPKLLNYILFLSLLVSAVNVIISANTLYCVLFLVNCFFSTSLIIFLSGNEFFALFFLIIYLGAIAILFLFVVMMLDIKYSEIQKRDVFLPTGVCFGSFLSLEICFSLREFFSDFIQMSRYNSPTYHNWYDFLDSFTDVGTLSYILYNQYVLQILVCGLILYLAVIGVSFLTFSEKRSRKQSLLRQLSRVNIL